ncbi:MAG: hypothetical protein DMG68_18465 [Acidobacteria bacterium]|nr:MAG: hypothetical protein DMG68_18465 [Acidobacteriota bacterium]
MLCLCGFAFAQDNNQPALTIYNQNFVVVREHVPLNLKPGVNHVEFTGITSHMEPDSVILRDPAGRALQILEQNYRNDPISQELLLSRYEGKTNCQRQGHPQRLHPEFSLQPGLSGAGLGTAHHRSRWRSALRTSWTAVVPGAG